MPTKTEITTKTKERYGLIVKAFESGFTATELAKMTGVTRGRIYQLLYKAQKIKINHGGRS